MTAPAFLRPCPVRLHWRAAALLRMGLSRAGVLILNACPCKGPLGSARRLPGWISGLERGRGSADRRWERGSFLLRLCLGKWLMLFSLKFQRANQKNALTVDSAKGKTGEKGCILYRVVAMKQPHAMAEPLRKSSLPRRISFLLQGMYED